MGSTSMSSNDSVIDPQVPDAPSPAIILESDQRLSASLLWSLQRRFFQDRGVTAWTEGEVPHFITSNTYIARSYARMAHAFLRDALSWDGTGKPGGIDLASPVYIVELGSGSGRFAFHFLKKFGEILALSPLSGLTVKLVMTDFASRTIETWREHPRLAPYVASGELDFARFDMERDRELHLVESGETLSVETARNPIIVIANYVFDSVPHDVFFLAGGQLHEGLVTLSSDEPLPASPGTALFEKLTATYEKRPIDGAYYDDPDLDALIEQYRQRLGEATLIFPVCALSCIRRLRDLGGGRMLLISADKGFVHEQDLLGRVEPGLAVHGSFSLMVNYHAIGQLVRNLGGHALEPAHHPASLQVCAYVLGAAAAGLPETRLAFHDAIECGGPDDFFSMMWAVQKSYDSLSIEEALAVLRVCGWDANILLGSMKALQSGMDKATTRQRAELHAALLRVWDCYFPIGEEADLAFAIGALLVDMEYFPEALEFLEHSLREREPDGATYFNMALCHMRLRQFEKALAATEEGLKLRPTSDLAKSLRVQLQAEVARHAR